MKDTSIADFFKEAFQIDWQGMQVNKEIDVSSFNKKVLSFNPITNKNEYQLVTKIIRKENSVEYLVYNTNTNEIILQCSGDHKLAFISQKNKSKFTYINVSYLKSVKGPKYTYSSELQLIPIRIISTKNKIPILDFEVDNNNNYFSNGILSHNTIFGNPETTSGGNALKFFASIRLEIRKVENLLENDEVVGIKTRIKNIKNKTAPPFRKCEMDISFKTGLNIISQYIDFAIDYNLVNKGGAGWFTLPTGEKVQGREKLIQYYKDNVSEYLKIKEKVDNFLYNRSIITNEEDSKDFENISSIDIEKSSFVDLSSDIDSVITDNFSELINESKVEIEDIKQPVEIKVKPPKINKEELVQKKRGRKPKTIEHIKESDFEVSELTV